MASALRSVAKQRSGGMTMVTYRPIDWMGREGRCAPMLSDTAVAILAFLRTIAGGGACDECVGVYLGVERRQALESIRELVDASQILCTVTACGFCRQRRLVARVW